MSFLAFLQVHAGFGSERKCQPYSFNVLLFILGFFQLTDIVLFPGCTLVIICKVL